MAAAATAPPATVTDAADVDALGVLDLARALEAVGIPVRSLRCPCRHIYILCGASQRRVGDKLLLLVPVGTGGSGAGAHALCAEGAPGQALRDRDVWRRLR
jgi:hypothetical protein